MASGSPQVEKITELLLVVHPGWFLYGQNHSMDRRFEEESMRLFYFAGKPGFRPPELDAERLKAALMGLAKHGPDSPEWLSFRKTVEDVDLNRYRKEVFNRYGLAIKEAAKRPGVAVAFVDLPFVHSRVWKYKDLKDARDRALLAETHISRLERFARAEFGNRFIKAKIPPRYDDFRGIAKSIVSEAKRQGLQFKRPLVRGIGELSYLCVAKTIDETKARIPGSKGIVDERYCGDMLEGVKARRIRRHTSENYARTARKEAVRKRAYGRHRTPRG
ncbi:MAG: hypothetical protein NT067_03355 [Candidatus Diapherotrites archaeon]|nr:hypothetical protein [Candidatus Diapherotrites archaeon]